MSTERRLVSIRRRVPEEERELYDAFWARVRAAATTRGVHAWRFVAATDPTLYVEFLESRAGDPREETAVAAALGELDARFGAPPPPAAAVEAWREPDSSE